MPKLFIMFQKEPLTKSFSGDKRSAVIVFCFLLHCLFMPYYAIAQDGLNNGYPILFRGAVIDAVTQAPIEGVQYFSDRQAVTDAGGLFSFYAHVHDTILFECDGYRKIFFVVADTLKAREYTMGLFMNPDTLFISEVFIIPRIGDLRTAIMTNPPTRSTEEMNATNNLKLSAYQSIVGINQLGNPDANYQLIRQQQKVNAYEKGGIPSASMVGISPFTILPAIYMLMKGLPENPAPPAPYLSAKEIQELRDIQKKVSGYIKQ